MRCRMERPVGIRRTPSMTILNCLVSARSTARDDAGLDSMAILLIVVRPSFCGYRPREMMNEPHIQDAANPGPPVLVIPPPRAAQRESRPSRQPTSGRSRESARDCVLAPTAPSPSDYIFLDSAGKDWYRISEQCIRHLRIPL